MASRELRQAEAVGRQGRGIGLHAHRRLLSAADRHQTDARQLRDLRRQPRVGERLHVAQRQDVGGERQGQDRRVRRVHFAVHRRIRQVGRQQRAAGVDRRLDFLLGDVDVRAPDRTAA